MTAPSTTLANVASCLRRSTLDIVFGQHSGRNSVCFGYGAGGFTCSDVSFHEDSSFGVELGFIDDSLLIFADDFESGDTSAWSQTVP